MCKFIGRLMMVSLFNLMLLQCAQASWVCYAKSGQTIIAAGSYSRSAAVSEAFDRCHKGSGNPSLCRIVECHPKYD
jgi:hypothetical protein